MSILNQVVQELSRAFKTTATKHEAHQKSAKILEQISRQPEFITELLRTHLENPEIYNRGHYPVVALEISTNPEFTLSVNGWIPYQNSRTDVATKPIHHHGVLLLSTANIYGPGYQHLVFHPPKLLDEEKEIYSLELQYSKNHSRHSVEFVDAWVPHLPLYPEALTLTMALWSHGQPTTWRDHLKHVPFIRSREKFMRELVNAAGLTKQLQLKKAHYYDFYPMPQGGFRGTADKVEHVRGPNVDHLNSLFHIVQQTGNDSLVPTIRRRLDLGGISRPKTVGNLLKNLERGIPISAEVSNVHLDIPYLSFSQSEITTSLETPAFKGMTSEVPHVS